MKKLVLVLWYRNAARFRNLIPEASSFADVHVYSARDLDEGLVSFETLCEDLLTADFALFGSNSGNDIWPQIHSFIAEHPVMHAFVGNADHAQSYEVLERSVRCDEYYRNGGRKNYLNLLKFIARLAGDAALHPEPARDLPWQGAFHPDDPEKVYDTPEAFFEDYPKTENGAVAILTTRVNWLNDDLAIERRLVSLLEERGYRALPVFSYYLPDPGIDAKGMAWTTRRFCLSADNRPLVSAVIKLSGSLFTNRTDEGMAEVEQMLSSLNCPVFRPIMSSNMSVEEWMAEKDGTVKDISWSIAMPEMDGCIEPIFVGGSNNASEDNPKEAIEDRCRKVADRVCRWIALQKKENREKKLVFILNNNPCASVEATVGSGANLDTLESVARLLNRLKEQGYDIQNPPADGKELIDTIMSRKAISEFRWTTVEEILQKGGCLYELPAETYLEWFNELPESVRQAMIEGWGSPPGEEIGEIPPAMLHDGRICITGVQYGNALVCVQPKRGCAGPRCDGTVCRILHDPHMPPTHQYFATYRYFERLFGADFLVHVGTHGNLEFLPGKGTGLSDCCYPDICVGTLPNLYLYNADNPPEGTIAKRRALATIVDHMQTTFVQGGLYDDLEEMDALVSRYERLRRADPAQAAQTRTQILETLSGSKLADQIKHPLTEENFDHICEALHRLMTLLRNTQIVDGMHVFGEIPAGEDRVNMIYSILRYEGLDAPSIRSMLCRLYGYDFAALLKSDGGYLPELQTPVGRFLERVEEIGRVVIRRLLHGEPIDASIDDAGAFPVREPEQLACLAGLKEKVDDINARLDDSTEVENLLETMNGRYVFPGPGGQVLRGRYDILPTGRNIYTLDPDILPTRAAWIMGQRLGDAVIEKFLREEGRYPETFGMYWMCNDVMHADGEGMAQLLYLIGVRPRWQPNGKVHSFEIIPLEELGRPRIDINIHVSGILRDNFRSRMDLVDEAVLAVAALPEPDDQNYVRKHTRQNMLESDMDFETAAARVFGARPGTYLNGISLQVFASAWKERDEMLDVFTFFNGYSYSKKSYGAEAYKGLQRSLRTLDITYNKVISDEHDLTSCTCYFGVQGGMAAAAKALTGREVKNYYGDSREVHDVQVRDLSDEVARIAQAKLLNPKWIEGQKRHGYKGAGDISKRIGRIYGWEATTDAVEDWVFDELTRTYIQNEENFEFFKENNPWAMEEIARRLIEAEKRGLWQPAEGLLESIQENYLELEALLESDMGDGVSEFQGGAIDIKGLEELEQMQGDLARMRELLK